MAVSTPPAPVENAPVVPPAPADGTQPTDQQAAPDITYDLKLPENSGLDPAVVERTTATARELHLSPDHAQSVLGLVAQEAASHAERTRTAAVEAAITARSPGGEIWEQENTKWKQAALADPELGNNDAATLEQNAALARRVLATYGGQDTKAIEEFLTTSGLASHPMTMKLLVRIGKAAAEDTLVTPSSDVVPEVKDIADRLWPGMKPTP